MDKQYRLQRHVYDLTRKYYLLGRDRLIAELQPAPGQSVLEMGCGTGRNLVAVAKRYPQAKIYGFDISNEMLKSSEAALQKAGVAARVSLAQGDATRFDGQKAFGEPDFDRVYFSYTLSMVPDWRAAMTQGIRLTKPDGRFSAVDFGTCERLPKFFKKGLYAWLDTFHVTPRQDFGSVAQGLAAQAGRVCQYHPLYRGYASYVRID
jgi:S-adenosylmethionine-diacylgycerolhomoserine-N-methlytransferase